MRKVKVKVIPDACVVIDVQKFLDKKGQILSADDDTRILFLLSTYWAQGLTPMGGRHVPTGRFYKLFYEPLKSYSFQEAFDICMGKGSFKNLYLSANCEMYRQLITVGFIAYVIEHRYKGKIIYNDIQWINLEKNKHQFLSTEEALKILPFNLQS